MGAAAAIGGLLLGAKAGKSATAPAITGSNVSNGSSQGSSSQGSTSSSGPYEGAQTGLNTLYGGAVDAYNHGMPQYYPGQTLADQSWDTQHGLNMAQQAGLLGTQYMNGANTLDQAQWQNGATSQGGYLWSNPAISGYQQGAGFDANLMAGSQGMSNIGAGDNVGRTAMDSQLGAMANGAMLNSNPYVDQMFNNAADQVGTQFTHNVMPQVASMFAGAGRYGSNQMADSVGQAQQQYGNQINQLATNIYGGNYANERNLQQGAMNQLNNTSLAERQQQLNALGQQTQNQLQGQNVRTNNLNGLSQQYGNERQNMMMASGQAPALANADYTDINALLGAGQQRDAFQQSQINDARARWDYAAQAPQNNLNWLNSIMSGAPQQSSSSSFGNSQNSSNQSSSGTSMTPGNPMAPMQGMMMGGMLGNSIAGLF